MKNSKVPAILMALILAVSGCTGGNGAAGQGISGAGEENGGESASGSAAAEEAASGGAAADEAGQQGSGSAAEEAEQGEYARAMAKRSQSSENSDPTITKVAAGGENTKADEAAADGEEKGKAAGDGHKDCTVMIYMVGSNLESRLGNATKDLEEIDGAGLSFDNYNVIAYTGGSTRWVSDVPCDRNCVLDMSRTEEERVVAQTSGNANMGLPETLSYFLNYCAENYPADHNMLILWDHGGGPLWGYGVDELYDSDALLLDEMQTAMESSAFRGGEGGKKLDLVGFDACLMGSLECMSIWQNYADYYVGSEELEPGDGWNYEFLKVLEQDDIYAGGAKDAEGGSDAGGAKDAEDGKGSGTFARAVGESILASFEEYYDGKKSETYNPDLTLACVDLGGIDALNGALDALAEKMADGVEEGDYAELMRDRSDIKSFGMTRDSQGTVSFYYDLVDVGNFADHMEEFYPQEAAAVREALGAAVAGSYANIDDASGMTLYYPYKNKGQFEQLSGYYASFLKTDGYSRFLRLTGDRFLKSKSWDWSLGEPEDNEGEYTLQLTDEQIENMTEASYTILTTTTFGGLKPIMENCKIEPDKDGVLHLDKNVKLAVLKNGESTVILRAVEVESDRKRTVYDTKGISLRGDVMGNIRVMDAEVADVTIRLSRNKKSGETQIQNIELEDNASGISGGKNSVDLMNWEGLAVLTGQDLLIPARDESGRLRPYEEWIRTGNTMWNEVPVSSEVSLDVLDIGELQLEDAYCQIQIRDVNGEKYASELVPIGGDERKKVEVPIGSGSMEFAVFEDHAELIDYEGRELRIEVPGTVEGVPVTVIGGGAFSWFSPFDARGYNPVTEVVLPDMVEEIGTAAFAYCWDLQKINAPADLKVIGDAAFMACEPLTEFAAPDGVEKIGKAAFAYCSSMTQFRIPKELSSLEEGAFAHCSALEKFTGGANPTAGAGADSAVQGGETAAQGGETAAQGGETAAQSKKNNPVLDADGAIYTGDGSMLLAYPGAAGESFAVKEGTKEIGYAAFDGSSLKEVLLPGSLTAIGNYAFYDCKKLGVPEFPEGLSKLGMHCFDTGDWAIEPDEIPQEQGVIHIPASLEEIGEHAFDLFINSRFEVSEDNRHYSAAEGALTNKAGDTVYYIATDPDFRAVYPEGIVEFNQEPLDAYDAVNILSGNIVRQIYLPASMTKFPEEISSYQNRDEYAFYHCPAGSEAEKFTLRQGLLSNDETERPEGTKEVATARGTLYFDLYSDHAVLWGYNGEDETLEIPSEVEGKAVTAVGNGIEPLFTNTSFLHDTGRHISGLMKIVIPEGVTVINSGALEDVSYGTEIVLPSTLRKLGKEAIYASAALSALPEGLEILEENCLMWPSDVPFVVTPKMSYIDGSFTAAVSAFAQEGENENYSVRDGVLYNADGTVLLRYPDGSAAEQFSIPEGTVSVGDSAFFGCSKLAKVSLPASLKQIGEQAFCNCSGLTQITYEEGTELEAIGSSAFSQCESLTEVSLPPIKEIGSSAFAYCEALKTVHFAEGTRSIGDNAFQNTAVADPQLPQSLLKIGDYAFYNYEGQTAAGSAETIRIPAGVSQIGTNAFSAIGNTSFEVDPENPYFSAADGLLLDKEKNVIHLCAAGISGRVVIPEGVTGILFGSFDSAPGVTDVEIPDSVVFISNSSFDPQQVDDGNGGLTEVTPVTIHCNKGSYAEFYAVSRGIPCEAK